MIARSQRAFNRSTTQATTDEKWIRKLWMSSAGAMKRRASWFRISKYVSFYTFSKSIQINRLLQNETLFKIHGIVFSFVEGKWSHSSRSGTFLSTPYNNFLVSQHIFGELAPTRLRILPLHTCRKAVRESQSVGKISDESSISILAALFTKEGGRIFKE